MATAMYIGSKIISAEFRSKISDGFVELYATEWSNSYEVTDEIKYGKLIGDAIESVILKYLLDKRYVLLETIHRAKEGSTIIHRHND